jgi:hypothetical protein
MRDKKLRCLLSFLLILWPASAGMSRGDASVARQANVRRNQKAPHASRRARLRRAKRARPERPSYIACGCGCCSLENPRVKCLYRSKGDDLQRVIEEDKRIASNQALCAVSGCSFPVKYIYCD